MSNNITAAEIITERIVSEIQERLDTYLGYLQDGTPDSMGNAIIARRKIEEWAVSDISFLLTEYKGLQHGINVYKGILDRTMQA